MLQAGSFQIPGSSSKRETRNPIPSPLSVVIHIFRLFMTSFTIGALFSPLVAYAYYLGHTYTGSFNVVALHWYELTVLLILLLQPLGAMKLLKVRWNNRNISDR